MFCKSMKIIRLLRSMLIVIGRNFCHSVIRVPRAAVYCSRILNNRHTHYILICDHIGDFLITMGYLESYRKQNKLNHVTICCTKKFQILSSYYHDYFDEYIDIKPERLYRMMTLGTTDFGQHVINKLSNITMINPTNAFVERTFDYIARYPMVSLVDCIKYGCLKLDKNANFSAPVIQEKKKKTHDTVLLCPDSRSTKLENTIVFEKLTDALKNIGFEVWTNLSYVEQKPIPGTKGIYCNLQEIADVVESIGYVVGVRSGVLDLFMYCNCRMVAIYPQGSGIKSLFDLLSLPESKAQLLQMEQSEYITKDVNNILNFLFKGEETICQ